MNKEDEQIAQAIAEKVKVETARIALEQREKLEAKMTVLEERLEKDVKGRLYLITAFVLTGVFLTVLVLVYGANKDVNQAVISLQKDVIYAQAFVRGATKELDDTRKELSAVRVELEEAKRDLEHTKSDYQKRLGQHAPAENRSAKTP